MGIRAVFFDLGGVIVRTEYQAPRQKLAEEFGMDYDDIAKIVFDSPSAVRASVGELTEEEHWHSVMKILKRPVDDYKRIQHEFFGGDVVDYNFVNFIRSLRPRYKVGAISNAWSGLRGYMERDKFADAFDVIICSAEVGAAKPGPKIFQIALEQLQVSPSEAVFVDDVIENVEACKKIGMWGIHFQGPDLAIKQVKALLKFQ